MKQLASETIEELQEEISELKKTTIPISKVEECLFKFEYGCSDGGTVIKTKRIRQLMKVEVEGND